MEETIIHTFQLSELNDLPEVFASLEELYIMLLDLVYTKRYQCQQQYQSIIQYCIENNYLVNVQYYVYKFTYNITQTQLTIGCLSVIPTMIASCQFEEAIDFSLALLNDLQTYIQDYHLDKILREKYGVFLRFNKLLTLRAANYKQYIDIIHILLSVAYEGLGQYRSALSTISYIGEHDDSVYLACLRIRFNLIYQQSAYFSVPLFEMASYSIEAMISDIQLFYQRTSQRKLQQKALQKTIFDYDGNLMNYVSTLYLARLHTLMNRYEEANKYYTELWTVSPDDESQEESIIAYLDNFVRYGCSSKNDISLVTKSPLCYHFQGQKARREIIYQALSVAEEFAHLEGKQQLNAVAYYYMGHLSIVLRDYAQAIQYLKYAKELNQTQYKYPSELVSVAWLPGLIDFDLLSAMMLAGQQEICLVNQPNYFDKLLTNKSIVVLLSPERYEMAEILHVLFNLQRKYLQDALLPLENVILLLVRVGMIDQVFAPQVEQFCYVQPSANNCQLIAYVYHLAAYFLAGPRPEIAVQCKERLDDIIGEFPQLEPIRALISENALTAEPETCAQSGGLACDSAYEQLFQETMKRKQFLEGIYKFLQKKQGDINVYRKIYVYYRCASQSPVMAKGVANLLPDGDVLKALMQCYQGLDFETSAADDSSFEFNILRAFCLHEAGNTVGGMKLLDQGLVGANYRVQYLIQFSKAKLLYLSGYVQEAIAELDQIESYVSSYDLLYYSALIDKILLHDLNGDAHEALKIGNKAAIFQILKCMVILKHFYFGMPCDKLLTFICSACDIELNDFDKVIIRAVSEPPQAVYSYESIEIYSAAVAQLSAGMTDMMKVFEHPVLNQVYLNYFCLSPLYYADVYQALTPQLSYKSIFYADLFDRRLSAAFFLCCFVTFSFICGQEAYIDSGLVYQVFYFLYVDMDISWINNFTVLLIRQNNGAYAQGYLRQLLSKSQDAFVLRGIQQLLDTLEGKTTEPVIALSTNQTLARISLDVGESKFEMSLVTPTYPYVLPKVYDKAAFFNPLNQFVLYYLVPHSEVAMSNLPKKVSRKDVSPACCILQCEIYPDARLDVAGSGQEVYQMVFDKPQRAKSAKPLLKVPKQVAQCAQGKAPKSQPLNVKFKRLKPIMNTDDDVVIGRVENQMGERMIHRRLYMPGQSVEQRNQKFAEMGEEQIEGEAHAKSDGYPAAEQQDTNTCEQADARNSSPAAPQTVEKTEEANLDQKDLQYDQGPAPYSSGANVPCDAPDGTYPSERPPAGYDVKRNPRRRFKAADQ